jgi:acyl carrier protein
MENRPEYINLALNEGFDVEIDVWFHDGQWWLGHDGADYAVNEQFILDRRFWIHAKNIQALEQLLVLQASGKIVNFFWHQNDDFTLTSQGHIWTYPNKWKNWTPLSVVVLPESEQADPKEFVGAYGVCSDFVFPMWAFEGWGTRESFETSCPVTKKWIQIVSEHTGYDEANIGTGTKFSDLQVDSLGAIELTMEAEDEFGIMIPDEEIEKVSEVGQAVPVILQKINENIEKRQAAIGRRITLQSYLAEHGTY